MMITQKAAQPIPDLCYQDDDLLVVNKPAGLLSIQDGYDQSLPHLRSILEPRYGALWMVHRLDKDTSGLVILARNEEAHRILNHFFREHQIEKKYHALVTPLPDWQEINIQLPLTVDADRKHRTRVNRSSGKEAHSICRVLKRFALGALMEIQILTGITHQIRAHLREYDLQIIGESLYSAGLPIPPIEAPRMMLHARSLNFPHPLSGAPLNLPAPYPEDFREIYTTLKTTRAQDAMI